MIAADRPFARGIRRQRNRDLSGSSRRFDSRHESLHHLGCDSHISPDYGPATGMNHRGRTTIGRHLLAAVFLRVSRYVAGHEASELGRDDPDQSSR
jgi:hypothetical protein